jgi:hypothetical protein
MICCILTRLVYGRAMPRRFHTARLDGLAIGLSGICLVHCVLSVLLVATLSGSATLFTDPAIHRLGLGAAVVLAAIALGYGYAEHRATRPALVGLAGLAAMAAGLFAPHGWLEVVLTVGGVSVLAIAHLMNARSRA